MLKARVVMKASPSKIVHLKGSGDPVSTFLACSAAIDRDVGAALDAGLIGGMNGLAEAMEDYARANAPWKDDTGAAREGLHGFTTTDGNQYSATISHGQDVEHAIWLELANGGRYAIIGPTQAAFASQAGRIVAGEVKLALEGKGSKFRDRASGQFT